MVNHIHRVYIFHVAGSCSTCQQQTGYIYNDHGNKSKERYYGACSSGQYSECCDHKRDSMLMILVLEYYSSSQYSAQRPAIMFALQELLDLVKMTGCSLIVWLKDKVMMH